MTDEKKAQLKAIREKMASLTDEQKRQLTANGLIATIEGRILSIHNTMILAIQARQMPTVVGGYQQWKAAGCQVKRGEHGMTMFFPVGAKDDDGNVEAERFFTTTVFDRSQVEKLREVES